MSWLSKILGYVPAQERAGISLNIPAWEVTAPANLAEFLRTLTTLVPPDSVLYLEDGSPSTEFRNYLLARPPAQTTKLEIGTFWPRPEIYHMAITPENLAGLADLAERHSLPYLAVHLHVYKDNDVLLQWYDANLGDPLLISEKIPLAQLNYFCNHLGMTCRHIKPAE